VRLAGYELRSVLRELGCENEGIYILSSPIYTIFYGLAVKTGSTALQNYFFFFSFLVCGKNLVFWGRNICFQIRRKKLMGHPSLLFLIFLHFLGKKYFSAFS